MWKAVLVLFMTSNTQPASMMIVQFPESFMSKTECQSFVAEEQLGIAVRLSEFSGLADIKLKVLDHELGCLEKTDGEPV